MDGRLSSNANVALCPALFYFDNSDLSISEWGYDRNIVLTMPQWVAGILGQFHIQLFLMVIVSNVSVEEAD